MQIISSKIQKKQTVNRNKAAHGLEKLDLELKRHGNAGENCFERILDDFDDACCFSFLNISKDFLNHCKNFCYKCHYFVLLCFIAGLTAAVIILKKEYNVNKIGICNLQEMSKIKQIIEIV